MIKNIQKIIHHSDFSLVLVILSIGITVTLWMVFETSYQQQADERFKLLTHEVETSIKYRLLNYEEVLTGVKGLFAASKSVDRNEWNAFIDIFDLENKYPGMQAVGYSKVVGNKENVDKLTKEIHNEGFVDFNIHPLEDKEEYHSIIFVTPSDKRNQNAFGLDMSFEENRHNTMISARDSGETSITNKITLVQEINDDVQRGFLMMKSIYKNEVVSESIDEKRNNITGIVYGAFKMNDLMDGIFDQVSPEIVFKIYDNEISPKNLMYDGISELNIKESELTEKKITSIITIYDKIWIVEYYSIVGVHEMNIFDNSSFLVLLSGTSMTGILFFIYRSSKATKKRLERLTEFTENYAVDENTTLDSALTDQKYEISKLANAFKSMQKKFKVKNDEIQNHIEELASVNQTMQDLEKALDKSSLVAFTDKNGIITYANEKFCKISKYSEEELIGQSHRILKSGYHSDEFYKNIWETISSGKIWDGDIKNKSKDGEFYWVRTTIVPFIGSLGTPEQYIAIRTDITKQKITEEKLETALEEIKNNELMKDEFASMVSHELKTPLTPIRGYCEMLRMKLAGPINKKQDEVLEKVEHNIDRLERLIGDVLDSQKLDMKKMIFSPTLFSTNEFMERIHEDLKSMASEKEVNLINNSKSNFELISDELRIRQVMDNLIRNALDFVPQKKGIIEIGVTEENDSLIFYVKDNGIGISKENMDKLFTKFYQVDTSSRRKHGGTGLGLVICEGIVKGIGGKIWITSEVGKGTTVFFSIPKVTNNIKNSK